MVSMAVPAKKQYAKKNSSSTILNAVPYEVGFHFYLGLGQYTGITANSLSEFSTKLQTIPSKSIIFHLERGDFQKWLRNIILDEELANCIDQLQLSSQACDEILRKELTTIIQKRVAEFAYFP